MRARVITIGACEPFGASYVGGRLNRRPSDALSFSEVVMMTPVLTSEAFAALGAPNLVYVRPVKAAEIMASVERYHNSK